MVLAVLMLWLVVKHSVITTLQLSVAHDWLITGASGLLLADCFICFQGFVYQTEGV